MSSPHRPRRPFTSVQLKARARARVALIMTRLCVPGSYIAGMPGTDPWDAVVLGRFAARAGTPTEVRIAARLLLRIWWLTLHINALDDARDARFGGPLTDAEWREIRAGWGRCGGRQRFGGFRCFVAAGG